MTNDDQRIINTALADSFKWILLTTTVGLVQVLIHALLALIVLKIEFNFLNILESGVLISFCLTLVASIFFDAYFQEKHLSGTELLKSFGIGFQIFPWVIVFMVSTSTVLLLILKAEDLNADLLNDIQISAVILSYIYAYYYKYSTFIFGIKKNA
ncbi:MAG: hypothetical protein ACNI26_14960 [Terasakiella sp.]|uniref:hypothetical protein n=1 Tax=unclassified Terasakiella TaxID=2614952 RepID=UPI003B000FED